MFITHTKLQWNPSKSVEVHVPELCSTNLINLQTNQHCTYQMCTTHQKSRFWHTLWLALFFWHTLLSCLAGRAVKALASHWCSKGLIPGIGKWNDLWSWGLTGGCSPSTPVSSHDKATEMPRKGSLISCNNLCCNCSKICKFKLFVHLDPRLLNWCWYLRKCTARPLVDLINRV